MAPQRLRINGRIFRVEPLPADSPNYGEMRADEGVIAMRPKQDEFTERDTFLHETMHAILHQQGNEDGGKVEEHYVRSLATGLLGVLRDNPTFAKWLIAK